MAKAILDAVGITDAIRGPRAACCCSSVASSMSRDLNNFHLLEEMAKSCDSLVQPAKCTAASLWPGYPRPGISAPKLRHRRVPGILFLKAGEGGRHPIQVRVRYFLDRLPGMLSELESP
jgi:hypothetical protein